MNYADYEQQLLTAAKVYQVPKSLIETLQSRFLLTFGILAGLSFLSSLVSMASPDTFGSTVLSLASLILFLLQLFSVIPYSIRVIRLSLKKKDDDGFVEALGSPTGWMVLRVLGLMVIFSFIVLLPYLIAGLLIESGSVSNILEAIKYFLLVLGSLTILFLFARIIGTIVAAASGQDVTIADMFKKSLGHVLSIILILLVSVVPLELLAQFVNYGFAGFLKLGDYMGIQIVVLLLHSAVKSLALLGQLYLFFTALSQYMKSNKIIA